MDASSTRLATFTLYYTRIRQTTPTGPYALKRGFQGAECLNDVGHRGPCDPVTPSLEAIANAEEHVGVVLELSEERGIRTEQDIRPSRDGQRVGPVVGQCRLQIAVVIPGRGEDEEREGERLLQQAVG